ncbi:MAG: triose-phosphate isomerase [Syntrophomonadaceae bacterium]
MSRIAASHSRKKLIAANWKMYKTIAEAEMFVQEFLPLIAGQTETESVICPPFTCLPAVRQAVKSSQVQLGAQDVFWENQGAYTGEISPAMLLDLDCRYVIIGHSERRHIMGETEANINRKLKAATLAGLIPIFCVGETLDQREKELAREIVSQQLAKGLQDLRLDSLVVAYEPVWAIGTGVNATPEDAQEMIGYIRECLARMYDEEWAGKVRILYGGSVKPGNIASFLEQPDIDGALVGGASLVAPDFASIVRFRENA